VTGNFLVKVKGTNIAGNGVPNNADPLDQDFALVVSNANESPVSIVQGNSVTVTAENGTPANGAPDPGEIVTVDLALQEIGTANSGTITAALQNSGGITPITTVQNYGTRNVGSPEITRPFQFSVPSGSACGGSITLTFLITDGVNPSFTFTKTFRLGTTQVRAPQTFSNPTTIVLPDGPNFPTPASVYPSNIVVNGVTTTAASYKVTMTLNGWTHSFPADNSFLLVGPNGQKFVPISLRGAGFRISDITLTLDDDAATPLPGGTQLISGTFRPAAPDSNPDFPAPAPPRPYSFPPPNGNSTFASLFGSSNPNGTWSLYIDDNFGGDSGFISRGWSLTITPIANVCSTVPSASGRNAPADFDGDGKTDIGIFRPGPAEWWNLRSSDNQVVATQFGESTDVITPGDFTGDGKADIAVWRPSTGSWLILRSEDGSFFSFPFGTNGDVPVPADYDGDRKTDAAVYRPSDNTWFFLLSGGGTSVFRFGTAGDQPAVADYDGDGRSDVAIFRPVPGEWWIQRSTAGLLAFPFGSTNDKPVQGDYTGDGKADAAFFRPSTGSWFVLRSEDSSFFSFPFGLNDDMVAPGDYDGDGKFDAAVFRPSNSNWFLQRTTAGIEIVKFGTTGDRPIPGAFVP
jgi:hypothetical protein